MKKLKYKWTVIFTTILICLTPTLNGLINVDTYGGECLIWMMPFAILALYKVFVKKEW